MGYVLDQRECDVAKRYVRRALQACVKAGGEILPGAADDAMIADFPIFQESYAVFVTLKRNGNLRGCIGNLTPVGTLGASLWARAQDAALHDTRFDAIIDEQFPEKVLAELEIEISILEPMRPIESLDMYDVSSHGIVMYLKGRSAVFLPHVATQWGWSRDETLTHLALKAGLSADSWRHRDARFEIFGAFVF